MKNLHVGQGPTPLGDLALPIPFLPDGSASLAGRAAARRLFGTARSVATVTAVAATVSREEASVRNRLLGALPLDEYERLRPHLERVHFDQREVLFEAEQPIRHVYFPETMVVSLVSQFEDGRTVEVGTVGFDGMAGLPLFLGDERSSVRAFAQIPGVAQRMDASAFTRLAGAPGAFHQTMLRFTQAFLIQVAQTAACNGAHLVVERCARWLLMTHDRVAGDQLAITHEFLAFMLGVRRGGVTLALNALREGGVIRYARGKVSIVDRAGLEAASCECYRVVRAHTDRLLPRIA